MVAKLKKVNLSEQVCRIIKQKIVDKAWHAGFKLASESDLADMFGVNRLTIRIALQKLNALGILETKVGDGTYVTDFDLAKYMSEVSDLYISEDMLYNVYDFRHLVELECLRLAVDNRTDEDLAELADIFKRFEEAAGKVISLEDGALERYADVDFEFHYKICQCSKNSLYALSYLAVREPIVRYFKMALIRALKDDEKLGLSASEGLKDKLQDHYRIMEAIKNKDKAVSEKMYKKMVVYQVK